MKADSWPLHTILLHTLLGSESQKTAEMRFGALQRLGANVNVAVELKNCQEFKTLASIVCQAHMCALYVCVQQFLYL